MERFQSEVKLFVLNERSEGKGLESDQREDP